MQTRFIAMFYCNPQAWVQPLPVPELDDSPGNIDTVAMIIRVASPLVCTLAYTIDGWHRRIENSAIELFSYSMSMP